MYLLLIFVCFILFIAFNRYVPVFGVFSLQDLNENVLLVDLRNYQTACKEPIQGALNIPYAYLKRYYQEIPNKQLVIITTDVVEKNLAVRFLKRKNFRIA